MQCLLAALFFLLGDSFFPTYYSQMTTAYNSIPDDSPALRPVDPVPLAADEIEDSASIANEEDLAPVGGASPISAIINLLNTIVGMYSVDENANQS